MKKIRIAMIGLKGVPAKWGGHEIYAEEAGKRLVKKGHEVTAFCYDNYNKDYKENEYEGIKIRRVYAGPYRPIEGLVGGLSSTSKFLGHRYHVAHLHGYGSFYYIPLLKKMGIKTLITAHMYDSAWNNPKWGKVARATIKQAFKIGVTYADYVSTVASYIQQIIQKRYGISSEVMYSGTNTPIIRTPQIIAAKYGLMGNDYILFLGRLDRIKRVDLLIKAYQMLGGCNRKLVIAGGVADTTGYEKELYSLSDGDPNIIFTGFVHGEIKDELLTNASFIVSPSINEGLPITVIEAAKYRKACLASDIPGHREVIAYQDGELLFFHVDDIYDFNRKLQRLSKMDQGELDIIGTHLNDIVTRKFNWDATADKLEAAYFKLLGLS